jgi:putative sterol carrier protein
MAEFQLTPETDRDTLLGFLKTINLKDPEERKKLRALISQATPDQFFTVILPYLYEVREDIQEKIRGTKGTIQIQLDGEGGGSFLIILGEGLKVFSGPPQTPPDFKIQMDLSTWRGINRREIQPQMAFFQGKIKFAGNIALAMKLVTLLRG